MSVLPLSSSPIDAQTEAFYLEVPADKVVLLQAFFELYEGLGVVRTEDVERSLVCVMTTTSLVHTCAAALEALRPEIGWKVAAR